MTRPRKRLTAKQVTAARLAGRLLMANKLSPWGWQLVNALLRTATTGFQVYWVAK